MNEGTLPPDALPALPTASIRFLAELRDWARAQGCIELKAEPHWPVLTFDATLPEALRERQKAMLPALLGEFRPSENGVLLDSTVVLDLGLSEEELLAAATKKTRQYIRKSAKDGVVVRESAGAADFARCLALYRQTAARAGFGLHVDDYYHTVAEQMGAHNRVFVAEYEGSIVAFLWLVVTPALAFELYGGTDECGQQLRANYCLKWQAMCRLRDEGVAVYDMNGLLNDGVSNFKLGFAGGHKTALIGTLDALLSPRARLWEGLLPTAQALLGKR
jgi:lipid II:glycine glycyltransferase (peptidoglycan interpeptide bridge formation enzyme)